MSILDDAIREHLELKRAHGADDAELKRLEDEAFGPPQRPEEPDPLAEAPTEFLVAPEAGAAEEDAGEGGRPVPNVADLQEAPAPPEPAAETEIDRGHSTEERHAIAEQPTEMFDVEGQFEEAPAEISAPSDEELAGAEQGEPRLAPAAEEDEPVEEDEPADEFDEFFSEQRLSDELNQALEAPLPDEPGAPATEEAAVFVDADEEDEELAEFEEEEEESPAEGATAESRHDDVLEDTPEFLEESPEDDDLWFEQKPPKDIDFGD
ncbi:MAG TPA: hypothetical protein VFR04_09470 [Solirubrobacterales bacterium]|nr:hypothetical protein [Solirubrobacterales bacterium]